MAFRHFALDGFALVMDDKAYQIKAGGFII